MKVFRTHGSRSCANWMRRCARMFGWMYGRVRHYHGARIFAANGRFGGLEIAPAEVGRSMLTLGMRGGPLHKKYKIYLDHVSVAHVPED